MLEHLELFLLDVGIHVSGAGEMDLAADVEITVIVELQPFDGDPVIPGLTLRARHLIGEFFRAAQRLVLPSGSTPCVRGPASDNLENA